MKRSLALIPLVVLASVPVFSAPHFWQSTAVAERGPISDRIVVRAMVVARDGVAQVSGPSTGRAVRVWVREGDAIEAGQVLAEIEGSAGLSDSRIVAPVSGVLLARRVDPGDALSVASQGGTLALFEIADPTRTEVRAEIEERDAARVTKGLSAKLSLPGGRTEVGRGVIERVADRIERRTIGADEARVRADGGVRAAWIAWSGEAPEGLTLGQKLEAEISLAPKTAATRVPRRAVMVRDGRTVVETPMLLWSRQVPVKVGAADGALAEISGIAAGTKVFLQ